MILRKNQTKPIRCKRQQDIMLQEQQEAEVLLDQATRDMPS